MKKLYLATLVSALSVSAFAAPAPADLSSDTTVSTKGGFEIKNDLFSAKIGARIHFDGRYLNKEDDLPAASQATNSSTSFRRARLSLTGKAYGWEYEFENDFAGQGDSVNCGSQTITVPEPTGTNNSVTVTKPSQVCTGNAGRGFRDMWIGNTFMGHQVRFGQMKPYRALDEMNSSNAIVFMERPFLSGSGLYNGRQRQQGVFIDNAGKAGDMAYGYGVSAYNIRGPQDNSTQGMGYNARGYFTPINASGQVLHVGASTSIERNPLNGAGSPTNSIATRATVIRDVLNAPISDNGISQDSYALELGYTNGPFSAQAEYATAETGFAGTRKAETVDTGYVQATFFLTDHTRRYDAKIGRFGNPSVIAGAGAIELKARYDMMENTDTNAKAVQATVGANYYINPNTRVMFEYVDGTATSTAGVDVDASAIQTRLQFAF